MKRSRFVRDQLWPIAVVAFFFAAVTCAAFILAGGAMADYTMRATHLGCMAGQSIAGAR